MSDDRIKKVHGGARPGAGRPRRQEQSKLYTFRASGDMARFIDIHEPKTEFIKKCIEQEMINNVPDFSKLGTAYPATMVQQLKVNLFDIGIVAGFPVPLDNDEKSQRIEQLRML